LPTPEDCPLGPKHVAEEYTQGKSENENVAFWTVQKVIKQFIIAKQLILCTIEIDFKYLIILQHCRVFLDSPIVPHTVKDFLVFC
jgi:hypothetical protein